MNHIARITFLALVLVAGQAYAACSGPTGQAGQVVYAGNFSSMAYCNGTNWVSMSGGVSVTVGGTTYNNTPGGSANQVQYNNGSGGFAGDSGLTYSSGLLTVTNVSATGNVSAVKFIGDGSSLTGISTQGDRIVSGSLLAVANSATGYISLTTGGTNWGYLSSVLSYLPTVSTSTIGVSNTANFAGQVVQTVAGGGGNYIVSSSASVSTSSANGGTIKLATGSGLVMTISGSKVGIGTSTPAQMLEISPTVGANNGGLQINDRGDGCCAQLTMKSGKTRWDLYGSSGGSFYLYQVNHADGSAGIGQAFNITDTGNVGIGTTSPQTALDVGNGSIRVTANNTPSSGAGVEIYYVSSNGYVTSIDRTGTAYKPLDLYGTTVTTHNTSDLRLKTGIVDMPESLGLAALIKLRPVNFRWKDSAEGTPKGVQIGLIAQEVQQVYPALVSQLPTSSTVIRLANGTLETIDVPLTLNYEGFIVPLIKAAQELKAANDHLSEQLKALSDRDDELQRQINELKASMK